MAAYTVNTTNHYLTTSAIIEKDKNLSKIVGAPVICTDFPTPLST